MHPSPSCRAPATPAAPAALAALAALACSSEIEDPLAGRESEPERESGGVRGSDGGRLEYFDEDDAEWRPGGMCAGEANRDGSCADPCEPDDLRCREGLREICDRETGGWWFDGPRAAAACTSSHTCLQDGRAAICVERVCNPGVLFCDPLDGRGVRQCNEHGTASAPVELCDDTEQCVGSACRSECDMAAELRSFVGCEYLWIDTNNDPYNDELQDGVFLTNQHATATAEVIVEERRDGEWVSYGPAVTVLPGDWTYIELTCNGAFFGCGPRNRGRDRHGEDTGLFRARALRVRSTLPIAAWHVGSDDRNGAASSSSVSILFPVSALDQEHYALTAPQTAGEGEQARGWMAVAAAQDDTNVTLRLSAPTAASHETSDEPLAALAAGGTWVGTLQAGDILQIASGEAGADLSGSYVVSDKPVAVFAGHELYAPAGGGFFGAADHISEQMIPVVAWGEEFVAARVQHPQFIFENASIWKVVASEDDTLVTFSPAAGTPADPVTLERAGDVYEVTVRGTGANSGHFTFSADQPIGAVQIVSGEPAMIVVVPIEQYLPRYLFVAPPFFEDTLAITRPVGALVTLDGAAPLQAWAPAGDTHEVVWIDRLPDGAHRVAIEDAGQDKSTYAQIQLLGMDVNCSYGYLGGLNVERINIVE